MAFALPYALARRRAIPYVGPNWFATVMGTGIVANAAVTLPIPVPGAVAETFWALAAMLLVVVTVAAHRFRVHLGDPVMGHFLGAAAMAPMTVGAGVLLVHEDHAGAVALDLVLWTVGTLLGLWTTVAVPRRMRHLGAYAGPAFGGWLMPVVPPMVSAATGALLVPHVPPALRPWMTAVCCSLFAAALVASAPLLWIIVRRALAGTLGAPATIPTLFIVLGPLGQSATAAHGLFGSTAALLYGVPVLALALVWLVVATRILVRTGRVPFAMTWWSFTFPLGTVVTGTSGLAAATGSLALELVAVALFALLVTAWTVVAACTAHGAWTGGLLRAPQTA